MLAADAKTGQEIKEKVKIRFNGGQFRRYIAINARH